MSFIETCCCAFLNTGGSHFFYKRSGASQHAVKSLYMIPSIHRSAIHLCTSRMTLAAGRLKSFDPVLLTRCVCPTCCTLHSDFTFAAHKSCIKPFCRSCGPSRETIKRLLNCSDLFRERYLLRIKWPHWLTWPHNAPGARDPCVCKRMFVCAVSRCHPELSPSIIGV